MRGNVASPRVCFSALQRAEIAEMNARGSRAGAAADRVSVLFNEPKLLKFFEAAEPVDYGAAVSVLFNEPKLLKSL